MHFRRKPRWTRPVAVRFSTEQARALETLAGRRNVPVSELIRVAVVDFLNAADDDRQQAFDKHAAG
jgi:hypothetical protein